MGRLLPAHQYSAGGLPDLSPVESEHLRGFDLLEYGSGFGRVHWHEDQADAGDFILSVSDQDYTTVQKVFFF